jgi:hypothetical protein
LYNAGASLPSGATVAMLDRCQLLLASMQKAHEPKFVGLCVRRSGMTCRLKFGGAPVKLNEQIKVQATNTAIRPIDFIWLTSIPVSIYSSAHELNGHPLLYLRPPGALDAAFRAATVRPLIRS